MGAQIGLWGLRKFEPHDFHIDLSKKSILAQKSHKITSGSTLLAVAPIISLFRTEARHMARATL